MKKRGFLELVSESMEELKRESGEMPKGLETPADDWLIEYHYEYYRERLRELLMEEEKVSYKMIEKKRREGGMTEHAEAGEEIRHAEKRTSRLLYQTALFAFRKAAEEQAERAIEKNLREINGMLDQTVLRREDLLGCRNILEQYDATAEILERLSCEQENPLKLLEKFLTAYGIRVTLGNSRSRFRYILPGEVVPDGRERTYYCDDFCQLLKRCSNLMRAYIRNEVTAAALCAEHKIARPLPCGQLDREILLSYEELGCLYNYLKLYDGARMNLPMETLYLLERYDRMEPLRSEENMERIAGRLRERGDREQERDTPGSGNAIFDWRDDWEPEQGGRNGRSRSFPL